MRAWLEPADLVVEEIPLYAPTGEGEHTFVEVEKQLRTTEEVVRELARAAGVSPREVGYAGRKDRRALTRQWLSVPGLPPEEALALQLTEARVISAKRHPHKLRTGQLRANRFTVRLRDVAPADVPAIARSLEHLRRFGMPNRYGPQRFGRDGRNAELARAFLLGRHRARSRDARFLVSALQAEIFNTVLAERPRPLFRLEAGDVAMRHASGGSFHVEDPRVEQPRADCFEISPTGPIVGTRLLRPLGEPGEREQEIASRLGLPESRLTALPRGLRARGARRPLRVRPEAVRIEAERERSVILDFTLPPGSYATVLVEELFTLCGVGEGAAPMGTKRTGPDSPMTGREGSRTLAPSCPRSCDPLQEDPP